MRVERTPELVMGWDQYFPRTSESCRLGTALRSSPLCTPNRPLADSARHSTSTRRSGTHCQGLPRPYRRRVGTRDVSCSSIVAPTNVQVGLSGRPNGGDHGIGSTRLGRRRRILSEQLLLSIIAIGIDFLKLQNRSSSFLREISSLSASWSTLLLHRTVFHDGPDVQPAGIGSRKRSCCIGSHPIGRFVTQSAGHPVYGAPLLLQRDGDASVLSHGRYRRRALIGLLQQVDLEEALMIRRGGVVNVVLTGLYSRCASISAVSSRRRAPGRHRPVGCRRVSSELLYYS